MSRVRTRFAPSPTGSLHLGNARTAVLNWMVARHHGGDFILRIEDTDVERNVPGAESELMRDLRWLGLDWDEGPEEDGGERGPHGPYRQSQRGELYARRAEELLAAGDAYRCFCSPEALEADRERALAEGRSPGYPGTCRALDPDEAARRARDGDAHVVRLATPDQGAVVVNDAIRGRVSFDAADLGDFVLVRSDGVATYNFAVVVDDAAMGITHVVRGAGHLSNTPYQLLLYKALGAEPPEFAHAPTVLGEDRTKLSKRSGARPLRELREEGTHPDAVVNYLSLLGWSSPSGDEVLPRQRLIEEVTLDRMNAADVVFDPDKLRWLSGRHIAALSLEELADAVRPWVEDSPYAALLDGRLAPALEAVRGHLTAFGQVREHLAPFLGPVPGGEEPEPESVPVLRAVHAALADVDRWEEGAIQGALRTAGKASGAKGRDLYVPVRRAVTGAEHGPPLAAVLRVQGRQAVLDRLAGAAGTDAGLTPEAGHP